MTISRTFLWLLAPKVFYQQSTPPLDVHAIFHIEKWTVATTTSVLGWPVTPLTNRMRQGGHPGTFKLRS